MKRFKIITSIALTSIVFTATAQKDVKAEALTAMRRATAFMYDVVSLDGGFVWSYERDFSRRWGELEAYATMVWVENSTPDVGHIMLDAYNATRDEYYYNCALRTAKVLIRGQLPCGGWNYKIDFAGEASERRWYETIGKNAWGAPEHSFYYGNATFDDNVTAGATAFLLRIYMVKQDVDVKFALDKALAMILAAQYPIGGFPQRYPLMYNHPDVDGTPDYTSCITLNDGVTENLARLLLNAYYCLGEEKYREAGVRAMECLRKLQNPAPSAGWSDQYYPETLKPAKARPYEPAAVSTPKTVETIRDMMAFYKLTGDTQYLTCIPSALSFLESIALDEDTQRRVNRMAGRNRILVPRFVELGTNKPLYLHRRGSHINNGEYYIDQNIDNVIGHYASYTVISTVALRREYEQLLKVPVEKATAGSPLLHPDMRTVEKYHTAAIEGADTSKAAEIIAALDSDGYWATPLTRRMLPYTGEGDPNDAKPEKYEETITHPKSTATIESDYRDGISTHAFIRNMAVLIKASE